MPIQLPALEYGFDALEPHISSTTLKTHHGKHHKTYVEKANQLLEGTPLAGATLEDIVRQAAQRKASDEKMAKLYNNAGQAWNHAFYWRSLRPQGGAKPQGALADAIRSAFGSQDKLDEQLKTAGAERFGSGWAWLVQDGQTLRVVTTSNADSPLTTSQRALLTIDVWEHAYYLDYQERRPDHLGAVIANLLNWDFAAQNFSRR
ncbi:MAG TPA: superoxide dismutase [Burkholderiaceae bacterium]|jgi:Fe-Mn family superoxide dismutase|nr:superoxide dismutase [Burkholderiaceae bacterium]